MLIEEIDLNLRLLSICNKNGCEFISTSVLGIFFPNEPNLLPLPPHRIRAFIFFRIL